MKTRTPKMPIVTSKTMPRTGAGRWASLRNLWKKISGNHKLLQTWVTKKVDNDTMCVESWKDRIVARIQTKTIGLSQGSKPKPTHETHSTQLWVPKLSGTNNYLMLVADKCWCFTTNPLPKTDPFDPLRLSPDVQVTQKTEEKTPMIASIPGTAHPTSVSRITSVIRAAMLGGVPWVLKASLPDMDLFWRKSFKTSTLSEDNSKIESQCWKATEFSSIYL